MSTDRHPLVQDYTEEKKIQLLDLRLRIIEIMDRKGISKRRLARDGNLPYTAVHDVLSNNSDPRLTTLHRLAKGLQVTIQDLL